MFALENYIKKLKDEQLVINEAIDEKRAYLEAGRKHIVSYSKQQEEHHMKQINA